MVHPKTMKMTGIGEVLFEKSNRAKYVNITIRPFNGIRVAVPLGVSLPVAQRIVKTKTDWIIKQIHQNKQMEQQYKDFITNEHPINKAGAKKKILNRLTQLSKLHNIKFNRVFIRNQKTRWGSCSAKGNISLNINIARLPRQLMDYVILHELVHIRYPNHKKKFWLELTRIIKNAKLLDKQLDTYRLLLIDPKTVLEYSEHCF